MKTLLSQFARVERCAAGKNAPAGKPRPGEAFPQNSDVAGRYRGGPVRKKEKDHDEREQQNGYAAQMAPDKTPPPALILRCRSFIKRPGILDQEAVSIERSSPT